MKKILILLISICSVFQMQATHLMGGEITWECIKVGPDAGKYIFKLKLYRDCDGTSLSTFAQTIYVWDHPTVTQMSVDFISNTDISPDCDVTNSGNPQLDCSGNPVGAVEEYIYESLPISLPGAPPATGWHFTWDSCCRNGAITNLVLSSPTSPSEGFTLRASMFPYYDNLGNVVPADPCFDSSPVFNESPKTIICTGYPFAYSHNASDDELDEIFYDWDEPLDDFFGAFNPPVAPTPLPFLAPYSYDNPLPGGVTLDSITGEIAYNSTTSGNFVTVVRIDAYKCGQLVAQIYREIQAVLISCPTLAGGINNIPPTVSPPFTDPITGLPSYSTSVPAGGAINFQIQSDDFDVYANGSPQDVTLEITGGQMAGDFATITDCTNPPCATFDNGAGLTPPFSNPTFVNGFFNWQTACSHVTTNVGCGNISNLYTFAIKAYDDFCPAPAITLATISIEVTAANSLPDPDLQCAFLDGNGDLTLDWNETFGANPSTIYHILGSDNIGGPYTLLADVNYPDTMYTIDAANIPAGYQFFYMTQESACANNSLESDTITPIEFAISYSDVNCWDDSDGQITIEVLSTMLVPFSYYINGVINPNPIPYDTVFDGLSTGVYAITVSDNGSCQITQDISISAPGSPLQSIVSDSMNICANSSDGLAVGSGAGGTPPYSYEWFDNSFTSFSINDTAFNLSAGSYYLEVTDANGCDTFSTVQVIAPQTALSGSPQVFGVACKGDSTGMIVGDATGSWAPYKYYWIDNLGDTLRSTSYKIGRDTLSGLASGVYNLHVYDAQDCFVSYGISVGEPTTSLSIDSISVVQTIACYGDSDGSARMFVSGGMPNYTYMWDSGETGLIAQNLSSGYRHVSLTDDWGCTVMDSIYISENPEIQPTVSLVQTVSCYGLSDGIVTVSSTGGIGSHIFFWSTDPVGHTNNPDTVSLLAEGSYYVTTQDALGCEVLDSIYVSEPEPLTMQATALSWISCFGADDGLAYATGQGGNTPYTFTWSSNNQVGDTINTITPGTHVVTVVDERGCTANDTVYMYEPDLLEIDIDTSLTIWPYCIGVNSASLTSITSGGTAGYTYLWDDNSVAPQLTATASHLLAGIYTVTVTDARGCTASDTEDIDSTTNTMSSSINILSNVSCFGGNDASVEVITSGAHAPYSYQWFGPNGFYSTTSSISSLYAETYSVTVSDTNNCTVNTSINLTEPAALIFTSLASTNATCLGACDGTVEISLTGGTAPYTGHAQNNSTGNSLMNLLSGDSLFGGVCAGDYTISLSDAHGCSSELLVGGNDQQTINALDTIDVAIDPLSCFFIFCHGDSTGGVALDFSIYDTLYSYNWYEATDPSTSLGNTSQITNLGAGAYVVEANYLGCIATDTMVLTEPNPINITASITHLLCHGDSDGTVDVSITGGSPSSNGYTYLWSNNEISEDISNLTAGSYTVTVTDSLFCESSKTFTVTQPDELEVTIVETSPFVLELSTVTGGTPGYTYTWNESGNNVGTGASYVVSANGTYSLEATDANNCTSTSNSITYNVASVINGEEVSFRVYPNPFREEATVDFGYTVKEATISIVDIYGKLIEQHELTNANSFVITNKNKASGVYFMKMETESENIFVKLIVK
ncbi:T9SS type A sorting domain-containing protein [Flavobacteriales bacterium]|nr:T9SS type A sorting domain-containing protein [Flavobacteriales bacterium]